MAKGKSDEAQLSLEFKSAEISEPAQRRASIVQFVDGPTRRLRAEATHRVAAAGIFSVSSRHKF